MTDNLRKRGGAGSLLIAEGAFANQRLDAVAKAKGIDAISAAIAVIRVGDPSTISFNQVESDIEAFMRQPWVMTGSDASGGHPRAFGTFARKYAHYVKARGVIDLRTFIERSTALTADTLGLKDRGRLRPGAYADVVVFDPRTYAERSTYEQPSLLAVGVQTVLVNGVPAVDRGALTGAASGPGLAQDTTCGDLPMIRYLFAVAAIGCAAPTLAQSLQQRVETVLATSGPGTRYGMVVVGEDGRELVAIAPTDRFIPASNTKMFPTAAAFATLNVDQPDTTGGASVRLEGRDVILTGGGDARLSSAADCAVDCLATLADAVAAKTRRVGNVVGDDTLYPDQRWSMGMSWNNVAGPYGTGNSALTLDDNEVPLTVTPGADGRAPTVAALPYYTIDVRAVTVAAGGKTDLDVERMPAERTLRLVGTIAADAKPTIVRTGIDDPAHYAAWRFKTLLEARGVKVAGTVQTRHRQFGPGDDPAKRGGAPVARPPHAEALARLTPPPLGEDLIRTNKESQNLHAEMMLRRLALVNGSGSVEDGHAVIADMLAKAGVPRAAWAFSDGSGMSPYNRLAPRGVTMFLRWVAAQPWGMNWRATLPIGGVDGTLLEPVQEYAAARQAVRQDRDAERDQRAVGLFHREERQDADLLDLRERRARRRRCEGGDGQGARPDRRATN